MSDADSESELNGTRPLVSKAKPRSHTSTASVRRPNQFRRKRRLLCFGAVAVVAALALLCVVAFSDDNGNYYVENATSREVYVPHRVPRRRFNILLFQWDHPQISEHSDCDVFDSNTIDVYELFNRTFDAIIFNATADYNSLPLRRQPQQYYVYALEKPLSAAARQRVSAVHLAQFFNLTLSYRLDSDIPWLTHEWYDMRRGAIGAPSLQPHWLHPLAVTGRNIEHRRQYNGTGSLLGLAIMDAPCNGTRNQLLQQIQSSMNVDVFGDCAPLTYAFISQALPRSNNGTLYKFYFAFEDELCTDYVSRHFYHALRAGIVPVVLGGANYTRFAPPHSYIEAEAFQSVNQLVLYLQYLHVHVDEYLQYLAWRQQYYVMRAKEPYTEVCRFLQRSRSSMTETTAPVVTSNLTAWWANSECRTDTLLKL